MSAAQHTPGPWKLDELGNVGSDAVKNIAVVFSAATRELWGGSDFATLRHCEANARLIASVPELLAALVWREQFERRQGESSVDQFERVAENFHRETGILRPGKDCVLHSYEDRQAAWDAWMAVGLERVRAAIARATGGNT
jgi:hypothetical protein